MNHSYYQKSQSQEHTNVQIKVNIPFLYFAAFNRQCRCFIVNHRVPFFSVSTPTFFFNFSDIFLISPMSDPSDFLLNRTVRAVLGASPNFRSQFLVWINQNFIFQTRFYDFEKYSGYCQRYQ